MQLIVAPIIPDISGNPIEGKPAFSPPESWAVRKVEAHRTIFGS
jgi:hypothetical protein